MFFTSPLQKICKYYWEKRRKNREYSQYEILFLAKECKGFSFFLNYTDFLTSSYLSRYNLFESIVWKAN